MADSDVAKNIIQTLQDDGFYVECPCCDEPISLRQCGLFYLDDFSREGRQLYEQYKQEVRERKQRLRQRRKDILRTSEVQAQAINIGFILERLAPCLSTFRFACGDCRSVFDPIDYVIFEGLCEKGRVSKIIFAEIKTGYAELTTRQREIRALVVNKKVEFDVYEVQR